MITELNKEQEQLMFDIKNEWLKRLFECKTPLNEEQAVKGIKHLYKMSGLKGPMIIKVDSPMACQIAANIIKKQQVWSQVGSQVESQVGSQVESQVWSQVRSQVWSQVRSQVGSQVRSQVRSQVGSQVGSQVRSQVGSQVRSQVRSQVESQVRSQVWSQVGVQYFSFSSYGSIYDYGWVSYIDFFQKIGIINNVDFDQFLFLLKSGIYDMIQLDGCCIYCPLPNKIQRDNENRLNSIDDFSISWADGYGQHYANGCFIPSDIFKKTINKQITIDEFFKIENEEIKSGVISLIQQKFGENALIDFFSKHITKVDTYVNKKSQEFLKGTTGGMNVGVYSLFKGDIQNISVAYVQCYCPSTDRMFFLGVHPKHTNAKDAIASLYRVPNKLAKHIKYIQRQGERFSTVFDDCGTKMLKNNLLSKEQIQDTTTISGDEYFEKMRYEY